MGKPCRIVRALGTHIFQLPQSLCPSELIFGWAEVRTLVIFGNKFIKQGRKRIPILKVIGNTQKSNMVSFKRKILRKNI